VGDSRLVQAGNARPARVYADETLLDIVGEEQALEQAANVACLPGIVKASYAMPDAHWGYGFPIGGVAAFDADEGGVVSAGGVGFDITCGTRLLVSNPDRGRRPPAQAAADQLFRDVAGLGGKGPLSLSDAELTTSWSAAPPG
jgi:tRNA-splicing ligase RtcB